jgi:hypothetical protein
MVSNYALLQSLILNGLKRSLKGGVDIRWHANETDDGQVSTRKFVISDRGRDFLSTCWQS